MAFRKPLANGLVKPAPGAIQNWGHPLSNQLLFHALMNDGAGTVIRNIALTPGRADIGGGGTGGDPCVTVANPAWTVGKFGKELPLNGSTQYIDAGGYFQADFASTSKFSGSIWVKQPNPAAYVAGKMMDRTSGNGGWKFGTLDRASLTSISASFYMANIASTNYIEVDMGPVFSANVWYHVGFSYDGSAVAAGVKLYLNGRRRTGVVNNDNLSGTVNNYPRRLTFGQSLVGSIDGPRIWNRIVTDDEFLQLYQEPFADVLVPSRRIISTPGVASAIKTMDTVARASIKTMQGVALASVKTWNGIA